MNDLLVDLGNSRLKWAQSAPSIWTTGAVVHLQQDIAALLDRAWGSFEKPERVMMANVAPAVTCAALGDWVQRRWSLSPVSIQPKAHQLGVKHCYAKPETFGADRWAALIAARGLVAGNACVVDCGTAVTVDALASDGLFRGGAIFPGLGLLRAGLVAGTGGIPAADGRDDNVLACTTADAVAGGTRIGLIGAVLRLVAEQTRSLGGKTEVILTGGDSAVLAPYLGNARLVPDLVLRGLARIATGAEEAHE